MCEKKVHKDPWDMASSLLNAESTDLGEKSKYQAANVDHDSKVRKV